MERTKYRIICMRNDSQTKLTRISDAGKHRRTYNKFKRHKLALI